MWTALQAAASPLGHSTAVITGAEKVPAHRANDGIRTRDPHLGKVMLYQLSYVRMVKTRGVDRMTTLADGTPVYQFAASGDSHRNRLTCAHDLAG